MPDAPALTLVCLGTPTARLAGSGAPSEVLWRKNLALLIYLALSPNRTRTREHLIGILWPETTERLARKSLTEAVRRLRAHLGARRLVSHAGALTLNDASLEVDAVTLEALAAADPWRALDLITGDFLEGFSLPDAPGFDEWASNERTRYRAKNASLLVEAGEGALADSRFVEGQDLARRTLSLDPLSEPATHLLLRAAALAGDVTSALRAYHEYTVRLEQELGEHPSRNLAALAERIRTHHWRRVSAKHADVEAPLVGRAELHRAVLSSLGNGVKRGPHTVAITGAAGLGKTRLLAECADRLTLEGVQVAAARPLESDHDASWSALRALVRSGLVSAPGIAATDPSALSVIAAVVPELAGRIPPRQPRDHAEVADALTSVIEAVARERPINLTIDDAHLADDATIEALHRAIARIKSLPVVLLITSLPVGDDLPLALLRLHGDVGRGIPGLAVNLKPLATADLRALVEALAPWCSTDDERDRLARRLALETAGSPFLAVALLQGLNRIASLRADVLAWPPPQATFDAPLPLSVPSLARAAIVARVAQVAADAQRLLATASVLGLALDLDLIAQLMDRSRSWLDEQLPHLERANLVTFDGERYSFAASLIAQVVRSDFLTPGQRLALRRHAAAVLASRHDLESLVLRVELLTKVGPGQESFRDATAVAQRALAEGAARTAQRALLAARQALDPLGEDEHAEFVRLEAQLAARKGDRGGAV